MDKRHTIDELIIISGYSASMIYDLTHHGFISPPVRGIDPEQYGSKGSYPACVVEQIARYKELKLQGHKKAEIAGIMKQEATHVQVLQGRG